MVDDDANGVGLMPRRVDSPLKVTRIPMASLPAAFSVPSSGMMNNRSAA